MEKTTRLGLFKLAQGDYSNHWEIPMNANAQAIDDEFRGLARELVGSETGAFSGLRGNKNSLKDRIDSAIDGNGAIVFNNNDLIKSIDQLDGNETTAICDRLDNIDRSNFVDARLRYLLRTVVTGSYIQYIRNIDGTEINSNPHQRFSSFGLDSQLFSFMDSQDPENLGGGAIRINPLGWCSLGGRLYYMQNSNYVTLTSDSSYTIEIFPTPVSGSGIISIDNRKVRSYVETGNNGSFVSGTSIFSSNGIGQNSSTTQNNHWKPEPFQILRIEVSPNVFKDYLIKTVNTDSIEIYGKFDSTLSGVHWYVLDYTAPCIILSPITDHTNLMLAQRVSNMFAVQAFHIKYKQSTDSFSFTRNAVGFASYAQHPKKIFVNMTGAPFDIDKFEVELGSMFPVNIKSMDIIVFEKSASLTNNSLFAFTINPKKKSGTEYVSILHPEIHRIFPSKFTDDWYDSGNNVKTYLRVYCDSANASGQWACSAAGSGGVTRFFWGVMIEYV